LTDAATKLAPCASGTLLAGCAASPARMMADRSLRSPVPRRRQECRRASLPGLVLGLTAPLVAWRSAYPPDWCEAAGLSMQGGSSGTRV
jgi:hypothetical protein